MVMCAWELENLLHTVPYTWYIDILANIKFSDLEETTFWWTFSLVNCIKILNRIRQWIANLH